MVRIQTTVGGGVDPPFLDDFLIKGRHLDKTLADFWESPKQWWDWPAAGDIRNFTCDSGLWRVHYDFGQPLCFYYERDLAVGIEKDPLVVRVDTTHPDTVWAKIGFEYVVVEREDFPRFQSSAGTVVRFNRDLHPTEYPNVWSLGNGYAVACTRQIELGPRLAIVAREAWWMVGRMEDAEAISHRVMVLKVYDGPYKYQSRGTDIKLADPVPLPSNAEYVMYSYDDEGLRGMYREEHAGVPPQKKALTIDGEDLDYRVSEIIGNIAYDNGRLVGNGTVVYDLPLKATKLLNLYLRGSELDMRVRFNDGNPVTWEEYDGLATDMLTIEIDIKDSLSAIRVEWERLEGWEVAGRPRIDIIPAGWGGSVVTITGHEGEGLFQTVDIEPGEWSASVNVRCHYGEAVLDVGGEEIANWMPLDKSIRNGDSFIVEGGDYDFLLSGRSDFSYDVDRFRIAPDKSLDWVENDIRWEVETENGVIDASDTINRPELSVSTGDIKRWRMRVTAPADIGEIPKIALDRVQAEMFQTGSRNYQQVVRWFGEGRSRIYYPETVVKPPVQGPYQAIEGGGLQYRAVLSRHSVGDIKITADGSALSYEEDESIYLDSVIDNGLWQIELTDTHASVFYEEQEVGRMLGSGLPYYLRHHNTEDVHLDTPAGLIQLRRGLGPRFRGWTLVWSTINAARVGEIVAWGRDQSEANDNAAFYVVEISG